MTVLPITRRRAISLLGGAGGAALALPWVGGCGRPPEPPRLAVVLGACSVNASYLGAYGGPAGLTPALDRLAGQAAVLEAHTTEAGQSGIAYASIMTGGHADHHGVFDHPSPLRAGVETLTSVFAAAGWEVAYWSGQAMAAHDLGYARGTPAEGCRPHPLTVDDPLFADILGRVAADPAARALVVATFTTSHMRYTQDPFWFTPADHSPAALPGDLAALGLDPARVERFRTLMLDEATPFELATDLAGTFVRWGLDEGERAAFHATMEYLYRCAIRRLDRVVEEIVAAVDHAGLGHASLIAVTADHGEYHHRPGLSLSYGHGYQLAPEVLRVPCLIRGPGVVPARHPFVTRSVDLLPTLAGLAGVGVPAGAAPMGVDLASVLCGQAPPPDLVALSHTALVHPVIVANPRFPGSLLEALFPERDPALMWLRLRHRERVARRWRTGAAAPFRLSCFDLAADPLESRDVAGSDLAWQQGAWAELEAYGRRLVAAWHRGAGASPLSDEEERRRLEALGYLPG